MTKGLNRSWLVVIFSVSLITLAGCYKPNTTMPLFKVSGPDVVIEPQELLVDEEEVPEAPNVKEKLAQIATPTPNVPIVLPTPRTETLTYVVVSGDTLRNIALKYQVSIDKLVEVNQISNPNLIDIGMALIIPPPSFDTISPIFKIIPDSELVNSPSNANFKVGEFVDQYGGYLANYSEDIDGVKYSGSEIVQRVAVEYSVNPRLLLTVLEYQSRWVTQAQPGEKTLLYPMRYYDPWQDGLYRQLGWAANLLNEGYYLWKENAISIWLLSDNTIMQVEPTINPGTAGILNLMRYLLTTSEWETAVSENGIYATYVEFFGYPFSRGVEPMIPDDLEQPTMQLPFEESTVWSFTGGPHGGWNTGSAWAAVDFAPPGDDYGCFISDAWVAASAPGEIVYSDHGAVIQDLDGDGIWQTGWSILYMHIATADRVEVGTYLKPGDRVGHPSCEGGFSTGTHLHIARRYNGEWVEADGENPLVMDGWVSVGYGIEYDGYLINGAQTLEAWNGRSPLNAIER
jgi:murein DD-endopeptidase MepM/ murein hydrolase activator NlpD